MKRQTQVLGVRNWYGDAFVSLQEEPLKVIDGFFSQYGAFVLSGCEVKANGSKYDIAPGLVVLEGSGADNATVKVVVPFAGITATALPVYLTLGYETETDVYNDGNVKPIDAYKREGYDMFEAMINGIREETVRRIFTVRVRKEQTLERKAVAKNMAANVGGEAPKKKPIKKAPKPGRNDPCPCGKMKADGSRRLKYKECCGRND